MEWLQTYNIGKALLESNKYQAIHTYYASYKPPRNKKKEIKQPFILDIILNLDVSRIELNYRNLDNYTAITDANHAFVVDNFFTSVNGNFTSYYLATPYFKASSILDFFGIKNGELEQPKKAKKAIGFEKEYEELIAKKLLPDSFKESELLKFRNKVRNDLELIKHLDMVITNLPLLVEVAKEKKYQETLAESDLPILQDRLNLSPSATDDIAYVRTQIKTGGQSIYLNQLNEYKEFAFNRFLSLAKIEEKNKTRGHCYFSNEEEVYAVSFPRDSVNILKANVNGKTTQSFFYGDNFLLSKQAYNCLKLGAWFIEKEFVIKIAGIRHYVIPDFTAIYDISDYRGELSDKLELAFNYWKKYDEYVEELQVLSEETLNSISFVGFESDGRQIDFINRIQLVKPDHFNKVFQTTEEQKRKIDDLFPYEHYIIKFSLAQSYFLFPIFSENTKVNNGLLFFKMLLENTPIEKEFLFNNYKHLLRIYKYGSDGGKGNYAGTTNIQYTKGDKYDAYDLISFATLKYQVLLNTINNIYNKTTSNMKNKTPNNKIEAFFEASSFNDSQKALFYLGKLIRRVAEAQTKSENPKTIMNKIDYSGMTVEDIQFLSVDVFEKMVYYNNKTDKTDKKKRKLKTLDLGTGDLAKFKEYFSLAKKSWQLNETENVFYTFSGYGLYWLGVPPKKQEEEQESASTIAI